MLEGLIKRSGIYSIGLIASRALGLVVFVLFARILLPENFGDYVLFLTLLQVITFFTDFGLVQWYQKRAHHFNKKGTFQKIVSARLLTLAVSIILASLFLISTSIYTLIVSTVLLITLVPEALLSVADAYYFEKNQSPRVALKLLSKTVILLVGFIMTAQSFTFQTAAVLYMIASFTTLLWFFPWSTIKGAKIRQLKESIAVLKSSSQYALLVATSFAYSRGDALIIRYMLNSSALGLYGAAYRYLEALALVPQALSQNLFPLAAKKKNISMRQILRIAGLMALLGLALSVPLFLASEFLITGILGAPFDQAVPLVKIFSAVLFMFFVNAPLAAVVQSSDLLDKFLPFGIANTAGNIILNILFIPVYGIAAAAWVMLLTEVVGFIINVAFVKKVYD